MRSKTIVTHGGSEAFHHHNVLEALAEGLACGADMFEFDVRRAGDGTLVVHHDAEIGTTALAALEYQDAAHRAGALGYRLPRLADVLDLARGRLRLDVELKETGSEDAVIRAVIDGGFSIENFIVTSFEEAALDAVRRAHPAVRTGLLVYDVSGPEALRLFQQSGAAFLGPDHEILDDDTLQQAQAIGIPLLPWTVNELSAMRRLLDAPSVIGVITDRPADALRIRRESG